MKKVLTCLFTVGAILSVSAQERNFGQLSGNFQTDLQYYLRDSLIDPSGEAYPDERLLGTGVLNLTYNLGDFIAGVRYENYQNNRVGLPPGYQGEGITYRYARFIRDGYDITVGNFYEQFGSGLILRAYEERGLGFDNNLDGLRVVFSPAKGLTFKGIIGRQRNYFDKSNSVVRGFDSEWSIGNSLGWKGNTNLIIGAGVTSKFQEYNSSSLNYPKNVAAAAGRINLTTNDLNIYAEYAYKGNDPSADNSQIYKPGHALYMTTSYTKGGLGLTGGIKYYDNFSYRSEPFTDPQQLLIGYLPSLTTLHTYSLPALYSYNTVFSGEQGYQLEAFYRVPRKSLLGGKYGATVTLSYSESYSLNKTYTPRYEDGDTAMASPILDGTDGYTTEFGVGPYKYFHDFHIEIKKTLSKKWKATATYYNFYFNNDAIRKGTAGVYDYNLISTDVEPHAFKVNAAVLELLYKIKPRHSIRGEFQALFTDGQDGTFGGDWGLVLLEYSIAPKWFFAVQDAYNFGNNIKDLQIHYVSVNMGYTMGTTRFQFGYGRQQQGVFCVGGICRVVPASNGFSLGITSNF